MKQILLLLLHAISFYGNAATGKPENLILAPGTLSANSATIVWDKPESDKDLTYHVWLNGKDVGSTQKAFWSLDGLEAGKNYKCEVSAQNVAEKNIGVTNTLSFKTKKKGKIINIQDYGAVGDYRTLNTVSIQKAIDACPDNGTVLIPKGVFVSGALFLKSHMTLLLEKGAVLSGSIDEKDYLPFYRNRFEGWEMDTYASLINAGKMDSKGGCNVEDLSICGEGTIRGGGGRLGDAMIKAHGMRSRGRLICLMNCKNVVLKGLNIENPPCWTIHYIYSKGVTCQDLNIVSTAHNGDGLDPDSSEDCFILNCSFSTGDDCIAIKSGKNPDGFYIGKPTVNVRVSSCVFTKGHGISIGSEMSGGVKNVLVEDCKAGNLLHGMQIKGTKDRGGYVKNVTVINCQLRKITIFSAVNYNNDGDAAPEVPMFEDYTFKNIDMADATPNATVININGFEAPGHRLKNVSFDSVLLPLDAKVNISYADGVRFENMLTVAQKEPEYLVKNSESITH